MKRNVAAYILIVDDEAYIRRSIKFALENEPYEVDEAVDGMDCLTKIKLKKYDVILLDIRMPRMDGMETLDRIQELSPESAVIMISGHGNMETADESIRKGAFDYLYKPLDLNHVLIIIRNALNRPILTETKVLQHRLKNKENDDTHE